MSGNGPNMYNETKTVFRSY